MEYEILAMGKPEKINFGATGVEEVLQNVKTYLSTPRFSVVLDRSAGINASVVDMPIQKAQAVIREDILRNLPLHEPRAKVTEIQFTGEGISGVLTPRVKVEVNLNGY